MWCEEIQVLVVDDDPDIRDALRDLLEAERGYRVITAADHAEALAATPSAVGGAATPGLVPGMAPDLALIDVSLGTESGLDLIPLLRAAVPDLVCIVMTAHRDAEYAATAVRHGADDYLFKPLDPARLLERLPRHIERQRLARDKAEAEARFRAVFEGAAEGIVVVDHGMRILDVNHAFVELTGYGRDEVLGREWSILRASHAGDELCWKSQPVLDVAGFWRGECVARRRDGREFPMWLSVSAVAGNHCDGGHYVVLFSDITLAKEAERELQRLAFHDPLTGLPNRARFYEALAGMVSQARRHQRQLALMFIDLDGFKEINDTLGHEAGDQLLVMVAKRLHETIRREDSVFRLGGDEFTVLLADVTDHATTLSAARRAIESLAAPYTLKGGEARISASIGVVFHPSHGDDPDTLLNRADDAMYRAKELGRNRFVTYDEVEG